MQNSDVEEDQNSGTGTIQPRRLCTGSVGASRYGISHEQLLFLVTYAGFSGPEIAEMLNVSLSTIKRRLRSYNIKLGQFSSIQDEALDEIVRECIRGNQLIGPNAVTARLKVRGLKVQRSRVRHAMLRVDPEGAAFRSTCRNIRRRQYLVKAPNSLWHVDGNHKLIRWRIVIHGGIDGFSRMVTFLKASKNNRASTVLDAFSNSVIEYGVPSRIRVDHGGENSEINLFMELYQGLDRGSVLRGRSVHNQRIERFWLDQWNGVVNLYHDIFRYLEEEGYLDPTNELHLWAIQYVFLPRINRDLCEFRSQWNNHPLRTERNQTPLQLFVRGCLQNINSDLSAIQDIFQQQDGSHSSVSRQLQHISVVTVPETNCPLSQEAVDALHHEMDVLTDELDLFGIGL